MKPLLLLFWGLVLVVVDLRIDMFDFVPDLLGWLMALAALRRLGDRDGSFTVAAVAAGLGAVVGIAQLAPGWVSPGLLGIGESVATTVMVFATCTGIARVAVSEPTIAHRARRIRTADLVLAVLAIPVGLAARAGFVPGPVIIVMALATLAVAVWFLVLLWSIRGHHGFQAFLNNTEVA